MPKETRKMIPVSQDIHSRFKAIAKANRYSMKVMMEIMVEEFEKKLGGM